MGKTIGMIDMNIFSALILMYLLLRALRRMDRGQAQNQIFTWMLGGTIVMLLVDAFRVAFDGGQSGFSRIMNPMLSAAYYVLSPIVALLCLFYFGSQHADGEQRVRRLIRPIAVLYGVYLLYIAVSIVCGWSYYIDAHNIFHRGPYSFINAVVTFALMLGNILYIAANRRHYTRSRLLTLLFILLPPIFGGTLQVFVYGVLSMWSCVALSMMLIYIHIQDQNLGIDYLTRVHNRRQLDFYLDRRIKTSTVPFAAMMIDIDNFKSINDTLGHQAGDEALINAVEIIKGCLRGTDVIARFGGDEFLLVADAMTQHDVQNIIERIRQRCDRYNAATDKPYKLELSIGAAIYAPGSGMTQDEFFKLLDNRMYEDKKRNQDAQRPQQ